MFFRGKICQNIGSSTQEDERDTFCALLQYVCTHSKGVLSLVNDHEVLVLCKKRGGNFWCLLGFNKNTIFFNRNETNIEIGDRGMNTRGENWLLWKGLTVCCILCHDFWTNYDLDLFSTSKWPSELQFCERYVCRWQKIG